MTASSYRPVLFLALAACAEGAPAADKTVDAAPPVETIDAAEPGDQPDGAEDVIDGAVDVIDGAVEVADAAPMPSIDAAPMIDAAPPADAMCTTTQLLLNPSFDADPINKDWVEVRDPENMNQRVISDSDLTPRAHSAPGRIWFGSRNNFTEAAYQDVAVPAGTIELVLTGQVYVGVEDTVDHAELEIRRTDNTVITEVKRWVRADANSAFAAFSLPITGNHAGTTVRLAFKGTTSAFTPSSWMFDTLALNATACP
jgi:hypothetical protein